jgi:hypothetical protein
VLFLKNILTDSEFYRTRPQDTGWALHVYPSQFLIYVTHYSWGLHWTKKNIEYGYQYDYLRRRGELEERLGLIKFLSDEAIGEIPAEYRKLEWLSKQNDAWHKLGIPYRKSWNNTNKLFHPHYVAWKDKKVFHEKWCGCKNWEEHYGQFGEERLIINQWESRI